MRVKIEHIIRKVAGADAEFDVTYQENSAFGHYSTNIAMRLAKARGENPVEFTRALVEKIKSAAPKDFFEKVDIAGPGFINFWIGKKVFEGELATIYKERKTFGRSGVGKKKTVIVEYSQPNIAKRMHVGHLRSTIIGDALANVYTYTGHKVVRWNYIGDWGTQFGKLIAAYKMWGKKSEVDKDPIGTLLALYVRFHDEMKTNPELEAKGQQEFQKLESGDKENKKLWIWFKKESLKEFDRMYKVLRVKFDKTVGESAYEKEMQPLVAELLKSGVATHSEGAVVIYQVHSATPSSGVVPTLMNTETPALIQKADGASLYLTRDIASLKARIKEFHPTAILYVVANEQALHFEQLFTVAQILKFKVPKLAHVKFGLMLGDDHKKFSTREGRAVALDELVEKIIALAREVVEKKNQGLSKKEKEKIARVVGIGALKYNDLRENRNSDIIFDWERMLNFSGDSAPYLQYTYARLRSIVRKAMPTGRQAPKIGKADFAALEGDKEIAVIRRMAHFPYIIEDSARTLYTNNIAKYIFELANEANRFYESTPILKDENAARRNARLVLIESAAAVIKTGLGLLGIETLEKI